MSKCIAWQVEIMADGGYHLSELRRTANLTEAEQFIPEGAYTTLRTYGQTGLILLDDHFDRLEVTAALLGHPIQLNRGALRSVICQALNQAVAHSNESRLRLVVDCTQQPGSIWIATEPLTVPSAKAYRDGVAVLVRSMHRENPKAKDSAFIAQSRAVRKLKSAYINEVLMVGPNGGVLEGLSSNFYAVQDGVLMTADEGVLPGLTRSLILDEAQKAGIPVSFESVPAEALHTLDEVFISSTSRAVLPVTTIEGQPVATGHPGPITQQLGALYRARLQEEIQEVCE